ncbi:Mediator of RNA polymerase II transcription subunit 19-A [Merluccius polli]|uniref:Mediator of RNA polymerase II transcription subunit 19 n=1 Tax=Merluccius polli TaxID=89951 RepID=A0AA47N7U1_MERPO|nr:Mediator of RNA polymerase II transcription subunit 19-A [Merluccius polli]
MIDCPGTEDGSSLRSLIEKPPLCGNSFSPLTGALLTGFRLHTGPLPDQHRLMHIQPPKKKSKHKHKHHRPQDPIPQETPSDSDPKKKKKKRDDDPDRKKKKKDKKKKKNRHSPDHPGLAGSQPNSNNEVGKRVWKCGLRYPDRSFPFLCCLVECVSRIHTVVAVVAVAVVLVAVCFRVVERLLLLVGRLLAPGLPFLQQVVAMVEQGSPASGPTMAMKRGCCSSATTALIIDCRPVRVPKWLDGGKLSMRQQTPNASSSRLVRMKALMALLSPSVSSFDLKLLEVTAEEAYEPIIRDMTVELRLPNMLESCRRRPQRFEQHAHA